MIHQRTLAIKGYQLELDPETSLPVKITEVIPLSEETLKREFSPIQRIYFYTQQSRRDKAIEVLNKKLKDTGFNNYVLLIMEAPSPEIKGALYPYSIFFLFQLESDAFFIESIEKLSGSEFIQEYEEADEEEQIYLPKEFIFALNEHIIRDTSEDCYSEKLDTTLRGNTWQLNEILRYGLFAADPRLTDEMLLREACGLTGNSTEKYFGLTETTQPERLKEIIENCRKYLSHTPDWYYIITRRLEELFASIEKAHIGLYIYNPQFIMKNIIYTIIKNDHTTSLYLPSYELVIDYLDKPHTEVYTGNFLWDNYNPHYSLLEKSSAREVVPEIALGYNDDLKLLLSGLYYGTYRQIIKETDEIDKDYLEYNDEEDKVDISDRPHAPFNTFWRRDSQFLKDVQEIGKYIYLSNSQS